ncbi:hypothetical protein OROGR_022084 [Orobanche gracilis]
MTRLWEEQCVIVCLLLSDALLLLSDALILLSNAHLLVSDALMLLPLRLKLRVLRHLLPKAIYRHRPLLLNAIRHDRRLLRKRKSWLMVTRLRRHLMKVKAAQVRIAAIVEAGMKSATMMD